MKLIFFTLFVLLFFTVKAQQNVFSTSDINNFWQAYDSVKNEQDTVKQKDLVQRLYVNKGSKGLKAFMALRGYSATLWASYMRQYPAFWTTVRTNTQKAQEQLKMFPAAIEKFRFLYPSLDTPVVYFAIGGLNTAGTVLNNMVLIGTEIAAGDTTINLFELPAGRANWLKSVFRSQNVNNIMAVAVHETVHTQQKGIPATLLGQCIKEGSCDFITELILETNLTNPYMLYGKQHENTVKEQFKADMYTTRINKWLYNGTTEAVGDLGYFMGAVICRSYYNKAKNKAEAIKQIIELNYSDAAAVDSFLAASGYYPEKINKQELLQAYDKKRPVVQSIKPFANGDTLVDASLETFTIIFSEPMSKKNYSINFGEGGKATYPVTGIQGFSEDGRECIVKVSLQPGTEYNCVIDQGFVSTAGYALKPYKLNFKTK
jgi:hypothetical protein